MGPQCAPIGCNGLSTGVCRASAMTHAAPAGRPTAAQSAACAPPERLPEHCAEHLTISKSVSCAESVLTRGKKNFAVAKFSMGEIFSWVGSGPKGTEKLGNGPKGPENLEKVCFWV